MKILSAILMVVVALFVIGKDVSADRLYHWIDSDGVSHISKEPPPEAGKSVDIMEYSVRENKPAGTAEDQSGTAQKEPKEQIKKTKLLKIEELSKPKIDLGTACYIQAGTQDVYVYVTEDRRPGGSSYQNVLWRGDIPGGQKILIKSTRGKIKYNYQRSIDDRTSGRNQSECVNGNVIRIR